MILLDANVLSELMTAEPDPGVLNWLRERQTELALPTVAIAEIAYGIEKLAAGTRRERLLAAIERLVQEFAGRIFDFDVRAAWTYGAILAACRRAGRPMSVPDALIAAIARVNGCSLATRNVRDFGAAGIVVVNPWAQ